MTTQHTPGPWWAEGATVKAWSHGKSFKITRADGLRHTPEGNANNARLIAAAPDLLAELIEVVRWYEACLGEDPSFPQEAEVFKRAREAIAKVTGGAK